MTESPDSTPQAESSNTEVPYTPALTTEPPRDKRRIPFITYYPVIAGVAVGLVLRLLFNSHVNSRWSAMAAAFIYGCPIVTGMVTVYVAEKIHRRSWGYYISAPFYTVSLLVLGTLLVHLEGLICAIVIVPMFALMGVAGGLLMGVICRVTKWPTATLYSAGLLPLLIASLVPDTTPSSLPQSVQQQIDIAAPPASVWQQLNDIKDIHADEVNRALAYRIGVPLPVSGVTEETPQGRVRHSTWTRNVHFDEPVLIWNPEHELKWGFRFAADSFPAGALDDHVLIGGRYFDLIDTRYALTDLHNGHTRLVIQIHYRVSTDFNFYANRVARLLLNDFSDTVLDLYKRRAESSAHGDQRS